MHTIAESGIDFREAMKDMLEAVDTLKTCVQRDGGLGLGAWIQRPSELIREGEKPRPFRDYVCEAISQIYYIDQQDSKSTLIFPGLVPATDSTLLAVNALNEAKIAFKRAVTAVKQSAKTRKGGIEQLYKEIDSEYDSQLQKRHEAVHAALRRNGSARLCIKQAYRTIPICGYYQVTRGEKKFVPARPIKLGWSWVHYKSITTTSVQKVREGLLSNIEKNYDNRATEFLRRLDQMGYPPNTPLAKVQINAPKFITNTVIPNPDSTGAQKFIRKQFPAVLPIFFPWEGEQSLPKYGAISQNREKDPGRLQRSDKSISDTPLLEGLPYFEYLNNKSRKTS